MTRINSAIQVACLTDEHLLAEHREIKRMPFYFTKALQTGSLDTVPLSFRLGKGHVNFFLNKQLFLYKRYVQIYTECRARGFNVSNYESNWLSLKSQMQELDCWNDYSPEFHELVFLKSRIKERITDSKKSIFKYYRKSVTKNEAVNILSYGHEYLRKSKSDCE